ncbi:sensor domain-containing protein [Streptomyces sp. NPDC006624]|uniref:sensor domain-containing protein n=1 Tax=Streptomyces sp. NPDC006624 TaxID=3154892 RepID=UPI0033B54EBD
MKRAPLAVCAASLLSLTALTACGGGSEPAADKPKAAASPADRETPAERLAKLVITEADVPGTEVKPPSKQDEKYLFAKSPGDVTTDKPACTPLALAMNQLALDGSRADLTHHIPENRRFTYITLMTYDTPDKAKSAFAGLSEGVGACGGGFTAKARVATPYDSVTAEKPVARGGDESLAFRATTPFRGITHTVHAQAVRSDDVVAVYFAADGMAMIQDRPGDAKLPAAVVKAQNAKLG